ncbi:Uncharacterised protein [Prevotella melaninogenica]|uniref:hypothetical protein n=1 Tax=Prevotella melaninogenica TaxID=28132 RepID=UPI0019596B5D|nr:hypothetical protein [Prevotella melaninogenica]VTY05967.1 Uncharacterised protein [Prevotella melaninogenica]
MKSNKVLSYVGGVLFIIATGLFMKCEQIRARQEAQQAKFQKVLVLKSKAMEKSKVQDRIK